MDERPALAFGATGRLGVHGAFSAANRRFRRSKGVAEELLAKFSARSRYFDAFPIDSGLMPAWLHPGRAARVVIDGLTCGYFGQLHPAEAARRKIRQPVFVGELYLDRLYRQTLAQPVGARVVALSGGPPRLFFHLSGRGAMGRIAAALDGLAIPEMTSFQPKELLRDAKGERSLRATIPF